MAISIERMRIRTKLILIIVILIFTIFIYGMVSYYTTQLIVIKGPYYEQIVISKELSADIPPSVYMLEAYLMAFELYNAKDKTELDQLIERSQKLREQYNAAHARWIQLLPDGRLKDLFIVQSNELIQSFFSIWQSEFLPALIAGNKEKGYALLTGPLRQTYHAHRELIDEVIRVAKAENVKLEGDVSDRYARVQAIAFATWALAMLLGGLVAWYLLKSLTKRLVILTEGLESVSAQITGSADQQAQATVQQSSAVNETTTTMDELNASFQHTLSIAQESSDRAKKALKVSEEGNDQLNHMVNNLSLHRDKVAQIVEQILRLSQLTRQIHSIASVTSNLTSQTNILALNAAIQAAHVKQYGEGFTVIATEIRKLADESKKFLGHIDMLSENIQQATDSTIKIAEEGNKTIQDIIQKAESTSQSFASITSITTSTFEGAEQTALNIKQQGIAVHQVLEAMENLNGSAQQTVLGMQQIRIEVKRLNELTNELHQDI